MALNTPTIRQLIQTRSQIASAPMRDSSGYSISDVSDSPSLYSRAEISPVPPAVSHLHRKPPPKYIPSRSPADGGGAPMPDNSSVYSASRALAGFLPADDARSGYSEGRSPAEEYPDRKLTGSTSGWFSDIDAEGEVEDDESFITAQATTPAPTPVPLPRMAAPTSKARISPIPPPMRPPQSSPPPPPALPITPNSLSPPISPPLPISPRLSTYNSHLSAMHLGPKMTFLSPAPWEDDESALTNDTSDEEGEPRSRSSSFAGGRKRKVSEDGRRPRGRTVSATRDRDVREPLKGLGLMHPSPAKANGATMQTSTFGTTSSSSSGGAVPLIKTGSKSRSRPASPVFEPTAVLAPPATSIPARSPKSGQKTLPNKFSLPRLRHAFQLQGTTSAPNGKPLPLPSPSTASFTSSLASPSPMETDFPRTPTSTSAGSLKPYGNNTSPNNTGAKSSSEQKRSVTLPDTGGNGMVLITLEQAQANARRHVTIIQPGLPGRSSSGDNLRESSGPGGKTEKIVSKKRSGFLRIFNGSPNPGAPVPSGARSDSDVPPVPALPAAFISMPVTPNLASATQSPRGSPPDHTPFFPPPNSTSAPSTIRERRQAGPSPPLEVNVLISRASGSDPSIVQTAMSEPAPRRGLEPGEWQGQGLGASLDIPRTPRTPAPKPLQLRPVSTAFAASFAGLIADSPGADHGGSGSSASPSRNASPRSPPSTTSSPPLPQLPTYVQQVQAHSRSRTQSGQSQRSSSEHQQQAALIASLQAQISTSKQAWRKRVDELEGEVEGLRREVGRLEGLLVARRSAEDVCEMCGK